MASTGWLPPGGETEPCFLCDVSVEGAGPVPWYDRVLFASPEAVAVPGLGALVEGYLLIAPRAHVVSTRLIDLGQRLAFADFAEDVIARLEEHYGPVTVFEHGGQSGTLRRSACVEHAHLHVMPGWYGLTGLELDVGETHDDVRSFLTETDWQERYLMARDPGGPYVTAADVGQSQFFRRAVARRLHRADQWDYAAVPGWGKVRSTIDRMAETPSGCLSREA